MNPKIEPLSEGAAPSDSISKTFEEYRYLLFSIAYRMVGSAMDAEDMVQETYLRYQAVSHQEITSPKAFLTTVVTRLCLDHLKSAKVQRESYVGPWLPEPLLTASGATKDSSPTAEFNQHESISMAFLVLLESLTPVERAVFLLREVFEYDYADIAAHRRPPRSRLPPVIQPRPQTHY